MTEISGNEPQTIVEAFKSISNEQMLEALCGAVIEWNSTTLKIEWVKDREKALKFRIHASKLKRDIDLFKQEINRRMKKP